MTTPDTLLQRLRVAFEAARDPRHASGAAAYMRNQFPFLGIRAPQQAAIYRDVTAGLPPPAGDAELATVAIACWELPEREYQHFGTTYLQRQVRRASPDFIPTLERLVTTKSWWDTVDGLATRVAGPLVATHPELRAVMDSWIESENIWLARVAILQSPLMLALFGLLVVMAAVLSRWLAVTLGAPDAAPLRPRFHPMVQLFVARQLLVALVLALLAAMVAIGGRLVRWRSLTRFGVLLAIRFLSDWLLLLIVIGNATGAYGASMWRSNWMAFGLTASFLEVALWGAVAMMVLRRTRLRGRRAFIVGCLLELALGSTGVSLTSPFQGQLATWLHGYAEPLRIALWAAVLTLVAGSSRSLPGRGGEPPEGAPVPARPMPDPPEPLVAQVNR